METPRIRTVASRFRWNPCECGRVVLLVQQAAASVGLLILRNPAFRICFKLQYT